MVWTNTHAFGRSVYIAIMTQIVLVDKNVLRFHATKKRKSTKLYYFSGSSRVSSDGREKI